MRLLSFVSLCLLTAGCIGTDFLDEPLGPVPAEAVIEESALSLLPGEDHQLTFHILGSNGEEISGDWDWSSRDAAVAGVDDEGRIAALTTGQTWIDGVVSPTISDSVLVTVVADPNAIAAITIEGATTAMAVGESRQLTAVVRNAQGAPLDGVAVDWSSRVASVATVDADGRVMAIGNGTTDISAGADGITSLPFPIVVGDTVAQRSGAFEGLNGYSVSGTAVLEMGTTSARLVLNEDFRAQNGPGLYVYLSPEKGGVSGGVNLGELTATSGAQTYDIPDTVNPDDFDFVIIHCQPFDIPFGAAELE